MKLIRLAEVSERTGVPQQTLRYWRHVGYGPRSAKIGRRIVYKDDDVEQWIAEQFNAEESTAARDPGAA